MYRVRIMVQKGGFLRQGERKNDRGRKYKVEIK